MTDLSTVLRQVGGPHAVSWPAFFVSWVLSVLTYLGSSRPPTASVVTWFMLLALGQVLAFAPLVAVHRALRSTLATRSHPFVFLMLFALVAVVRGMVLDVGLLWAGAEDGSHLMFRVFAAMPAMVVAMSATAVIVGSASEHRLRLAELLAVNGALDEARQRTEQAVTDEQSRALAQITDELQDELEALDPARPQESAEVLHRLAADVVRPLSHELANAVPTWRPRTTPVPTVRVSPWRVVAQVPAGRPFMPVATPLVLVSAGFGTTVVLLGVTRAIAVLGVGVVVAFTFLSALNLLLDAIPQGWPRWVRPLSFIAATVASGAATAGFVAFALPDGPDAERLVPSGFRYGMVIVLLLAVVKAYATVRQRTLDSLQRRAAQLRWSVARARQVQWYQQRALSRILHGPAQSALNAAAMRIDAARQGHGSLAVVIEEARTDLEDLLGGVGLEQAQAVSLDTIIEHLTSVWSGLCAVRVDVDSRTRAALNADRVCRTMIADILTEGVSNAIRHGGAGRVEARVQANANDALARIQIWDDGLPPDVTAARGLGLQLLDECTVQWQREERDGGTELFADLPLAEGAKRR